MKYYGNTSLAPDAQFYIGLIHYNQGNYDIAAQDFDEVLEKDPTDNRRVPQAFYYKGMSLLKMDQRNKAADEFHQLIAQYPNHDLSKQACTELRGIGLRCPATRQAPAKLPPNVPRQEVAIERVGRTIAFGGLLGWAFGPRNFMKNRSGISCSSGWQAKPPAPPRSGRVGQAVSPAICGFKALFRLCHASGG